MSGVLESQDTEMCRPFINALFQRNWSDKQQNEKYMTEIKAEKKETVDQILKAYMITPRIQNDIYVPVNKVESKQIVDGYIETNDKYAIRCRDEMLTLMKQGHELQKKLKELRELKGDLFELKR